MKRIIALLALASFLAGQNAKNTTPAGDGYKELAAVATSADVLTLDDGEQIQLHNGDRLSIGETYVLLLDPVNDDELLNYWDLETYELKNMEC